MYIKALQDKGSIRKAATSLGLTKSKFMVLLKKEQGLCTATTSCQNKPKPGCTRCEEHLRYAFKTQDKDRRKETHKQWSIENKDHRANYQKQYQKDNRDKINATNRKYSKTKKGKDVNRAKRAYRRALQKQATPPWVDKEALKRIYENCPEGYHVDHIIPLEHELICGLHVPGNLQYLPAVENESKGNKWDGTCDNKNYKKA